MKWLLRPLRNTAGTEGSNGGVAAAKPAEPVGGPGANPPQGTGAAAPAAGDQPIFKGAGGEFKTAAELAAYTAKLEQQIVEKTLTAPITPAPAAAAPAAPTKTIYQELGETIFTDPEGTIQKLEAHLDKKRDEQSAREKATQKTWDDFYAKNPDLNNVRFVVESVKNEKRDELASLKVPDALDRIATEARKRVDQVRQAAGITETVVNGSGTVTGSGSGSGSGANPAPAKPQTFVDEIKEMRAKKKARY